MLTKAQLSELRRLSSSVSGIVGLVGRVHDESARGVPWRIPTPKPTPESVVRSLREIAASLLKIADQVEATRRWP